MANKKVVIVGAGIAGLAAGCYARMNGYDTTILELHTLPGGLCTSWKRKGYTFDGCLHWLVGSSPANSLHGIWEELGAVQDREMVDHEVFYRVEEEDGKVFEVFTDIDRLEAHMRELAPADRKLIRKFTKAVRRCQGVGPPEGAPSTMERVRILGRALRMIPTYLRYRKIPVDEFARGFTDPFLRKHFAHAFTGLLDFPVLAMAATHAWLSDRAAGYPIGGSLEFSRAIEKRYRDLGGKVKYKAQVDRILVEGDRAVGVKLADGREERADYVISAADGYDTIFRMLEGKYVDDEIRKRYEELPTFPALIQISLGVDLDLSAEPHWLSLPLPEPIDVGGNTVERLSVRHYCHDPNLAPAGKSSVVVLVDVDWERWKGLAEDREAYEAEKRRSADAVIAALDRRFPGLAAQVEVVDVATPATWKRYTNNWKASFEGWLMTTRTIRMRMSRTLPGLSRFYMCGQWVSPGGGVPPAALSGRNTVEEICRDDRKPFATSRP